MSLLGQSLPSDSARVPTNVGYAPNSVQKYCSAANDAMCHLRHCAQRKTATLFANHEDQTFGRTCASIAVPVRLELSVIFAIAAKNSGQGFAPGSSPGQALDPRGKEVKVQGVTSVLPTRKPRKRLRLTVEYQLRLAERRNRGL